MRTTLDIDDDVLAAAKDLAEARRTTAGKMLSELARKALTQPVSDERLTFRNGVPLLPPATMPITPDMVENWLEEDI